jgi:SEC-C motif-containing protein
MLCPCGSDRFFETCCGPFHSGALRPPTAEALMRSRYSAYALGNIGYVESTTAPETRDDFDRGAAESWAKRSTWLGLRIVSTERGEPCDDEGVVEFVATYETSGERVDHRERSEFRKAAGGQWLYVRGAAPELAKVGRNDPCPCGSGKKYKKCCGA